MNEYINVKKIKKHWGNRAGTWAIGEGNHWTEHIAIQERINEKVSGSPHKDPYQFLIDFLNHKGVNLPLSRCLTLGCGAGDLERGLSKYNFCKRHDAYDIADKAIEKAKEKAKEDGLTHIFYEVADINNISLQTEAYDVIFGVHSIHHLAKLEHIFAETKKALTLNGVFTLVEFVGPTKFQWTERQLDIVNSLLQILPQKYRFKKDGTIKTKIRRPTLFEMNFVDPSEAIRSGDILNILSKYFDLVIKKDLGGTILHLLLEDIAGNFDCNSPKDMRLLKMLFEVEDAFLETGEIPSDFTVVIAQNRIKTSIKSNNS